MPPDSKRRGAVGSTSTSVMAGMASRAMTSSPWGLSVSAGGLGSNLSTGRLGASGRRGLVTPRRFVRRTAWINPVVEQTAQRRVLPTVIEVPETPYTRDSTTVGHALILTCTRPRQPEIARGLAT